MDSELCLAKKTLKKYKQEHVLNFYDELSTDEKTKLISQINSTDFNEIKKLYENSKLDDSIDSNRIEPINYIIKKNLDSQTKKNALTIGKSILSENKLAVITVAGGQGSRLGFTGPKGSYEINVPPKKSLFEFVCDKLKQANDLYDCDIYWYIMTSPINNSQTKDFFEKHNYFGYSSSKVKFFVQNTLPIIDTNAKVILDTIYSIRTGPNGNGDIFKSFCDAGYLKNLKENNIDWIFIGGIDNIILEWVDPLFIGLTSIRKLFYCKQIVKENRLFLSRLGFCKVRWPSFNSRSM